MVMQPQLMVYLYKHMVLMQETVQQIQLFVLMPTEMFMLKQSTHQHMIKLQQIRLMFWLQIILVQMQTLPLIQRVH